MDKVKIQIPSEYKELFNPYWWFIAYYGGRYSGKSYNVGLSKLLKGRKDKKRFLCTRQIQNTIKDSVHKLLSDQIMKFGFNDYEVTSDSIKNTVTGSEFIFKGLLRNIQEIKSLEGIDDCWVEEAQTVTQDSWNVLLPTIRKEGSQITATYNRLTELDPVHQMFAMLSDEQKEKSRIYTKQVNFDVMEKLGLLSDVIKMQIEKDKSLDPDLFAHIWLGEPIRQGEHAAIARDEIMKAMQRKVSDEGQEVVAVDVARLGGDRIVLWKRKGLKTISHEVYQKLRINETVDKIKEFVNFNKQIKIMVDDTGVGGGVTDQLMSEGYTVVAINFGSEPADKDAYPNLISEAWFYLSSIIGQIELPLDQDLLMELSTRQYKMNAKEQRCIESKDDYKKRGYRSPDLADACIMCYYNPPTKEPMITVF